MSLLFIKAWTKRRVKNKAISHNVMYFICQKVMVNRELVYDMKLSIFLVDRSLSDIFVSANKRDRTDLTKFQALMFYKKYSFS